MTRASKWAIHTIQINHKYRQLLPLAMSKKNKHERSVIAIQQAKILKLLNEKIRKIIRY